MNTTAIRQHALAALILVTGGVAMASEDATSRVSESRYFSEGSREQATPDRVSTDEYAASDVGRRSAGQQSASAPRGKDRSVASVGGVNVDFWIYSADVELFADQDRDGFYSGIDLLFDADTVYGRAEVYAVVYLSEEGGPWMEYADTEDFVINGTSPNDDFTVVTELLAGYPAGDYDVLIELYDAFDNTLVADLGPAESSALSFLPLEDAERDVPVAGTRTVVVNRTGGGGATGTATLAGLLLLTSVLLLARRLKTVRTH